jgi:hypothetical protein
MGGQMAGRVVVVQLNDGVQSGDETEVSPPVPGDTPRMILERKASSAEEKGWTVEWDADGNGFHCWKTYPENDARDDEPSRRDRFFRMES